MSKEDNKQKIQDTALAGASLGALGTSKNMILGKKKMYHGTSKENWEKIRTQGLRADRGGIGGASTAIREENYIKASKGNVHLTRVKPVANLYTNLNKTDMPHTLKASEMEEAYLSLMEKGKDGKRSISSFNPNYKKFNKLQKEHEEYVKNHKGKLVGETLLSNLKKGRGGKRINISMDYDKYKSMIVDNDQAGPSVNNKFITKIQKNIASKGPINVLPEEIAGSSATLKDRAKHTLKAMPSYIKNNPARFGGGLALAGAGAYGLKKLNDKYIQKQAKKKEIEKKAMEG